MIDISRLSPTELDRFLHLQAKIDRQEEAQDTVIALRDYYYGQHPVLLTSRQKEFLGALVNPKEFRFAHNLVRTVVDTLRERLNVTGFTVNGMAAGDLDADTPAPEAKLAALMWSWWNSNRMDSQQIRLHRRTLRDGKSYAIVDFDNETGRPRINLHKVDDGDTGCTFHRDPTDNNRILFAARYFHTYDPLTSGSTGFKRKTVYLAHEIRKYIKRGGGDWEPTSDPEDIDIYGKAMWPLPWRDRQGMPLGVAAFQFENPGGSEMSQIIGLQNGLNKSWLDLIAAADASGFPMVVIEYDTSNGLRMPARNKDDKNITGDDEFQIGPGLAFEGEDLHVHRLDAANLQPMIDTIWAFTAAISGVSRTPQYYLKPIGGSDVPSGESLKQLDSGLVKRAEERQLIFGQSWADVLAMCVKVARTFGSEDVPELENMDIATQWADANVRNELVQAQQAQIYKDLGMPDEHVWATAGAQPEQIAAFKDNARVARVLELATILEALRASEANKAAQTQPQPFGQNGNGQNG